VNDRLLVLQPKGWITSIHIGPTMQYYSMQMSHKMSDKNAIDDQRKNTG